MYYLHSTSMSQGILNASLISTSISNTGLVVKCTVCPFYFGKSTQCGNDPPLPPLKPILLTSM